MPGTSCCWPSPSPEARAGKSSSSGGGTQPIDAVFVFDTSYSMGAKDGDKTRLERAKEAAVAVIDTLPDKSSVQVFACSDRAVALGPVSRYNRDQARQLVQSIELTSLSTDFLPGLTEALAATETGTAPAKEIYVFTDMQKSGFERQLGAVKSKYEEIKAKANLIFIRCGNPERKIANVTVTDVQLLAAIPHTKTRVPFKVTLKNTGNRASSKGQQSRARNRRQGGGEGRGAGRSDRRRPDRHSHAHR